MAVIPITPEKGWKGLADALTRAQPGDEYHLQAGLYRTTKVLSLPSGIRLIGRGDVEVEVDIVQHGAALIIDKSDVVVSGLTMSVIGDEVSIIISIQNTQDILITDCVLQGNSRNGIHSSLGIHSRGCQNTVVSRCKANRFLWGIHFKNSHGSIDGNECNDNENAGIFVEGIGNTKVVVSGNRCFENSAGIVFHNVSGNVVVTNNNCWSNRVGIYVQKLSSDTLLSNNRCHCNGNAIIFSESSGIAQHNVCWSNAISNIAVCGNAPNVTLSDNQESPVHDKSRLKRNPILDNLPKSADLAIAEPTSLLDFLASGGCPSCFLTYWLALSDKPQNTCTEPSLVKGSRSDIYEVVLVDAKTNIVSIPSSDWKIRDLRSSVRSSIGLFNALIPSFSRECAVDGRYPLWNLALISSNDLEFEQWLQDDTAIGKTRIDAMSSGMLNPPQIQKRDIDFAGYGDAPDSPFLETALLKKRFDTWRGRIRERGKALASLLPIVEFALLLSLLVLFGEIANYFNLWKELIGLTLAVTVLILLLIVANRHLPAPLRFSRTLFRFLIFDVLKDVAEKLPKYLPKWLLYSEYSRRNWLKRELFGYRWFGMGKKADGYIVVIRNVDITSEAHRRDLRLVAELCPRKTGLLLITQLPGTSMLTSGFLDVWFPKNAPDEPQTGTSRIAAMQTYVVHDVSSVSITSDDMPASSDDYDDVVSALQPMLGWPDNQDVSQQITAKTKANSLFDPNWTLEDLLPTLVLGSTPHMYMQVKRENNTNFKKEFFKQIEPYPRIFSDATSRTSIDDDVVGSVLNTELEVNKAKAIYLYTTPPIKPFYFWGGRVGYRRPMAAKLRQLFCARHKTADEANGYLCKLLACAEWYHVRQAVSLLESEKQTDTDMQKLPLHMEAALFLLRERQQLSPDGALERFDDLTHIWSQLSSRLRQSKPAGVTTHQIERLCAAYTAAMSQYCPTKVDDDPLADAWAPLQQLLEQAIDHPALDSAAQGCWGLFVGAVVTTIRKLAMLPLYMGKELLTAKLSQEWHELPDSYRSKLHETLDQMPALLVDNIGKAETAESLLESAFELTLRPSLLIYCLGRLAGGGARESRLSASSEQEKNTLAEIASAVWQLTQAVAADGVIDQAEELPPMSPSRAAQRAALALLIDPQAVAQLADRLREMSNTSADLSERTNRANCELEGVSLGTHGMLDGVLEDVEECRLLTG